MKKIFTTFAAIMISAGVVGTNMAIADGSEERRGLGGRTFLVHVEVVASLLPELPVGTVFPNCYIFESGGTWIDPGFPVPGFWVEHKHHTKTPYTAFAEAGGLVIVQRGTVKPDHRYAPDRLKAHSTLVIGELTLAEFVSKGREVDECPL